MSPRFPYRLSYVLIGVLVVAYGVHAQQLAALPRDTSTVTPTDSLLHPDTTKTVSGIDSVVNYAATDSVVYDLSTKTMSLFGQGNIKHKDLGLKAENIDINWDSSILHAKGVPDPSDSTGKRYRGLPDLIDGSETYHGSKISYDFRTKKGKIDVGRTEIEKGYYYGEEIKKVDTDVLFVASGRYTTCDLEHPHYYFASPEMKVTLKDKVVARPVYLYIADVPVFALPFAVFPTERGRRSGFIAPAYGESSRGRYLTHLGYYWAINDYTDINIRGDGYTKGSWVLSSDFRYALRYDFSGSISGSYANWVDGERGDPGYDNKKLFNVNLTHHQTFDPTMRLDVNFTFTSGSYYHNTSTNLQDLLQQQIISNATLSKSWEGTPNSMSVNIQRVQNLQPQPGTVEISEVLPGISFNRSQSFPFRPSKRSADVSKLQWYELIGYSYAGQLLDTRTTITGSDREERRGIQHTIPINASPKIGYFTLTPFFDYTEKWYDKYITKEYDAHDSLVTRDVKAITAVRYYDLGVSASTKLYGIVQPGILGITGIRHQMTPTLSYTYQPDFSKRRYGYYDSYIDTNGVEQKYSRYEREVFGGAPGEERQAISLRIGNVFEMKTTSSDTSGKENKFQLLNLDLSTSYNFARDSLKFDEVGVGFRTSIGQLLSIGGSSSFNLYQFRTDPTNPAIGRRVNKFLLKEEGRLAQLTNFNISISTRLSGEKKQTKAGPIKTPADSLAQKLKSGYVSLYDEGQTDFSIPWNLDLTWNFSQNQSDPRFKSITSNLSIGLGFNLTEFWKITASTSYDIVHSAFAAPQVTVYRDLHCWELNFNWIPTGQYRQFKLEIRLKAPELQDIKVTKQFSERGVF